MLTCFGMIWNYEKNSKQNTKFGKICALSKNLIYSNLIVNKNLTYWGNYKCNKKNSKYFIWKFSFKKTFCFWQKDLKKDNISKWKVNTLAC
jgi:hypothetical protein